MKNTTEQLDTLPFPALKLDENGEVFYEEYIHQDAAPWWSRQIEPT